MIQFIERGKYLQMIGNESYIPAAIIGYLRRWWKLTTIVQHAEGGAPLLLYRHRQLDNVLLAVDPQSRSLYPVLGSKPAGCTTDVVASIERELVDNFSPYRVCWT